MSQPVSKHDVYLDADGKVTTDEKKAAQQIAFKGSVISQSARQRWHLDEDGSSVSPAKAHKADDDEPVHTSKVLHSPHKK